MPLDQAGPREVGPWRRSSTRRSAWRRCASRRSTTRRSFSSQVISVSVDAAVRATRSNSANRSSGSSVQFCGIGARRQRSVPLSNVSQPRRYSSVRPMVLSGMVSQTIQWVPAGSSKSRSAMRHANCTGQTTAANRLRTTRLAGWQRFRDPRLLAHGGGPLTDVAVVALPAADAMSPPAELDDLGDMPTCWPDGPGRPDRLIRRPGTPAMEQPAARGSVDGLPGLVRCRPVRPTVPVVAVVARIGRVAHAAEAVSLDSKYWRTVPGAVKDHGPR